MQKLFKKLIPMFDFLLAGSFFATITIGISVWPLPSHYSSGNSVLWIAEDVHFTYKTSQNMVRFHHAFDLQAFNTD